MKTMFKILYINAKLMDRIYSINNIDKDNIVKDNHLIHILIK